VIRRAIKRPWLVLAGALLAAAATCGVVAALTWSDFGIEGAYLNSSPGVVEYSGVYSAGGAGRIWLGLAIGLAIAGVLVLALSAWQSRKALRQLRRAKPLAPAPPAQAPARAR
jgi:hypothetical protein